MLNRWLGIVSVLLMLFANAAILLHDVVPAWFAGDPPPCEALLLAPEEQRRVQIVIRDTDGRTVGRSWTIARRNGQIATISSATVLESIALPNGLRSPRVLIETELTYRDRDARVDNLDFSIHGLGFPVALKGENMLSNEFPCKWRVGEESGTFNVPADATKALGDVVRPFDRLPGLYVGQTWRIKLINPLAYLIPQMKTEELAFETALVEVTHAETIEHEGQRVETLIVEAPNTRAWVAPDGRILRQQVKLPLFGTLTLVDEPYDEAQRESTVRRVPHDHR